MSNIESHSKAQNKGQPHVNYRLLFLSYQFYTHSNIYLPHIENISHSYTYEYMKSTQDLTLPAHLISSIQPFQHPQTGLKKSKLNRCFALPNFNPDSYIMDQCQFLFHQRFSPQSPPHPPLSVLIHQSIIE